ncbi:MAG: UDP-N-acetylglucosamine 2-epimerase (non-hydrolyzing) [Peptococcaceae bacterium]|jgi:UDP-GlcNAc3NAcA epimerase|nr:UDP-N-acetylglucosamine 2-epimerase (non-hydrolyzing) [Peptococcaceae bacterium]MDH7526000.1 UDP-N-acetylglucosamine 2-epimerase (non-hydrolyzing) [Peptococcaceae bacterium]
MKIVTIVGARPQFIKAAIVSRAIRSESSINEILVHTGQHYDTNMSEIFFDQMGIPAPYINLGIGSGTHGSQTGRMLESIEEVLFKEKPDAVLVYGDTNSTLAGVLAAAKLNISGIHVEAGLRSFNKSMPEEINRVLTDHAADILFAPTETAVTNLKKEGISTDKIFLVGDVMYDSAIYYGQIAEKESNILDLLKLKMNNYVLTTFHRAENTDRIERLKGIVEGLILMSETYKIVIPLHPRTRNSLQRTGLYEKALEHFFIFEPLGYLDMIKLVSNALFVITDSGGLQKEAFFFGKPCITLRDETEWVELVNLGWNYLVSPTCFKDTYTDIVSFLNECTKKEKPVDVYGGGKASKRIVEILNNKLL